MTRPIRHARFTAAPAGFIAVNAWSRRWWALWFASVRAGRPVDAMAHAARRGLPWRIAPHSMPSDVGMVDVPVSGPGFAAWAQHFERRGVRLPRPSKAPVIFAPSAMPPEIAA